jgi:hypothetical protein
MPTSWITALAVRSPFLPDRDHGRLVEDDAFAADIDESVRRAEIDRQIAGKVALEGFEHEDGSVPLFGKREDKRCRGSTSPDLLENYDIMITYCAAAPALILCGNPVFRASP